MITMTIKTHDIKEREWKGVRRSEKEWEESKEKYEILIKT